MLLRRKIHQGGTMPTVEVTPNDLRGSISCFGPITSSPANRSLPRPASLRRGLWCWAGVARSKRERRGLSQSAKGPMSGHKLLPMPS